MIHDLKVELIRDHTRYHPSLVEGAVGETTPAGDADWARIAQQWVMVKFPQVTLELRWKHLRVIDARWKSIEQRRWDDLVDGAKSGKSSARVLRGKRGGLVEVLVTLPDDRRVRLRNRKKARELIALMVAHGCRVEEET